MATINSIVRNGGGDGFTVSVDVQDSELSGSPTMLEILRKATRALTDQHTVETNATDAATKKAAIDADVAAKIGVPAKA